MELAALRVMHKDITTALGAIEETLRDSRSEPEILLLSALYTKALMVKLQLQADMEMLK